MFNLLFQQLQFEHLDAIITIISEIFLNEFNYDNKNYLRTTISNYLVNKSPDEIGLGCFNPESTKLIGTAFVFQHRLKIAELQWFVVDPAYRRQGIGDLLLKNCINFAKERNYRLIILYTLEEMKAAQNLYKKQGFFIRKKISGGNNSRMLQMVRYLHIETEDW